MLLALFAVLSSKRTKSNPILYFCTVFRPWKMTRSRKQPVFDTKRKIYFKARFKYILPLFRSLHLLEHVPEKVLDRGEILKAGSQRCWNNVQPFFNRRGLIGWHFNRNLSAANLVLVPVREHFKQNIQALAKTLIMNYLPFAKETERSEILLIIRKIHDMFICCACFLFCCNHIRTICD